MINHIQNMVYQNYDINMTISSVFDVNYNNSTEVCGYQFLLYKE